MQVYQKLSRICPICGSKFTVSRSHRVYCSTECAKKAQKKQFHEYYLKYHNENIVRVCPICGKMFNPKKSTRKYCSKECSKFAHKQSVKRWHLKKKGEEFANNFKMEVCSHNHDDCFSCPQPVGFCPYD